jgi:hypothetical protein
VKHTRMHTTLPDWGLRNLFDFIEQVAGQCTHHTRKSPCGEFSFFVAVTGKHLKSTSSPSNQLRCFWILRKRPLAHNGPVRVTVQLLSRLAKTYMLGSR